VPLALDFNNLEERCLKNMDKCRKISENAQKFIFPFFDEEQEKHIT
jgi:hypothetical protein